jgi:hypothetical protein
MRRLRRSGRIASEIPIVLVGTDATGKVFSEETRTVVLSRHGAGIVSRYAFAPDELLTLRLPGSTEQAEIRLVGEIGGQPGSYIYGVTFVDPDPHFWPVEFPPPEPIERVSQRVALECSLCRTRQNVEQHEIEEDVYSVNGNVLRYCARCGTSTSWTKALAEPSTLPNASPALNYSDSLTPSMEPSFEPTFSLPLSSPSGARTEFRPPFLPDLASNGHNAQDLSASSESVALPTPSTLTNAIGLLSSPEPGKPVTLLTLPEALPLAVPARKLDAKGRPVNTRLHLRIRVTFSACVRHPGQADEIVECENISKGGLCFHSRVQYSLDSYLDVAAPYSPGEPALFVPARIKRVEALSGGKVFRYGVEYANRISAAPSS